MFVALSLVMSAACLLAALGKLFGHPMMRASARHFGIPWSRYRLIALPELAATTGFLAGLAWHPLGLAAAAGMASLLVGALITHLRASDGAGEMARALLLLGVTSAYVVVAAAAT